MSIEIIMPAVSTSMTEGTLARWVKKTGDTVKKGEIIAEIETDKAVIELAAEEEGILGKLLVSDGDVVRVGSCMGLIMNPGESVNDSKTTSKVATKAADEPSSLKTITESTQLQSDETLTRKDGGKGGTRIFASPLARRLASQHGLNLNNIEGTGPQGRIVKRDIDAAIAVSSDAKFPSATGKQSAAAERQVPKGSSTIAEYVEIPHTSMRKVIAQRLSESKQQIPHFYLTIDCRIDGLLGLRRQINEMNPNTKISVNDFVIKAVAAAMMKVPAANASWTDTAIQIFRHVDISVAVATPSGLITPVIHDADTKSLGTISNEIKALADRAKQGKLLPGEYQGGGFTISNLGMYGVKEFSAIINPPQACILAVGAGELRAVVIDGAVTSANVMTCTLSVDHRVVDGSVGAEFLSAFKSFIENPLALLI